MAHKKGGGSSVNGRDSQEAAWSERFARVAAIYGGAAPFLCAIRLSFSDGSKWSPHPIGSSLKLDTADLDGRIVLPVTRLILYWPHVLNLRTVTFGCALRDDFSNDFRLRGVGSGQELLLVGTTANTLQR